MFKNKPFTPNEAAQYVAGFLAAFDLAGAPMARAIEATEVLMDFFNRVERDAAPPPGYCGYRTPGKVLACGQTLPCVDHGVGHEKPS